jgi:hypothetical protein
MVKLLPAISFNGNSGDQKYPDKKTNIFYELYISVWSPIEHDY